MARQHLQAAAVHHHLPDHLGHTVRVYSETKREWRLLHTPSAVRIRAGMAVRTRPGCVRARARGWVFTPASPTVAYAGQAPHGPSMSTLLEGTLSGHAHLRWGRTAARPPADPPARLLPARRARLQTRAALVQATAYTKRRRLAAGAGPMANPVEICPPDCDRQSASSRQTQQTKERALSESSAGSAAAANAAAANAFFLFHALGVIVRLMGSWFRVAQQR